MSGKIKKVLKKFLEILVDEIDGKNSTPSLTGSNSNCIQDCISGNLVNLYNNKTIVDARNSVVNVNALNNINGEIILDITNKKLNIDKLVFSENLEIYNTSDTIVKIDSNGNITAPQFIGNAATATTAASCSGNAASATSADTATTALACSGNAATATTAASCSGNAASASVASSLASNAWSVPSNLGNDAVINLKTTRPYEWRIKNRDNGKTGELWFEFYNAGTQGWECKFRLYGDSRNADLSAPGINYNKS